MDRFVSRPSASRVTAFVAVAALLLAPSGDPLGVLGAATRGQLSIHAVGAADAQSRTRRTRARTTTRRVRAPRPAVPVAVGWTSPRGASELAADFANMVKLRRSSRASV